MIKEKSCGAVVFTRDNGVIKYVIVENTAGRCHGFPKGHVEGNETELQTARREIKEETSLDVSFIEGFRREDSYPIKNGRVEKTVVYFLAEYEGQKPVSQPGEIGSVSVLPLDKALELLEFENTRQTLCKADAFINRSNGIVIKPMLTDEEIKGKAYVHFKSWHEEYKGIVSDEYLDKMTLQKCEETAFRWRDNILVALDGGRVVGFAGYGKSAELPGCGEIFALYVLPEYYGSGLGRLLLDAAFEKTAPYGKKCLWVLKENGRAIRFYEKAGFHKEGTEKFIPSLSAVCIRMIKVD